MKRSEKLKLKKVIKDYLIERRYVSIEEVEQILYSKGCNFSGDYFLTYKSKDGIIAIIALDWNHDAISIIYELIEENFLQLEGSEEVYTIILPDLYKVFSPYNYRRCFFSLVA